MATDGRMLLRLVRLLLECILLHHAIGNVPSVQGECIWYGLCNKLWEYIKPHCLYMGPAKPVQEETRYVLEKYCPQFASGPVCCGNDQLDHFQFWVPVLENIFGHCPSCMDNVMQYICGMICSPDQSDFIEPVETKKLNSTEYSVIEINYFLSDTYMEATFNSCRDIIEPVTDTTIFERSCGGRKRCSADRMFTLLDHSYTYAYVPTKINYEVVPLGGYIPYNPPTRQRSFNDAEKNCKRIKNSFIADIDKTDINEPTADIDESTTDIHEPTADIDEPTADIDESTTDINEPTTDINEPTTDINEPTTDINEPTTYINESYNFTTSKNNSTIPNQSKDFNQFNTTENILNKTCSCINYEMLYHQEQRKLQVEEDYYSVKKDYLRQKLVLLKEQTEAFKTITMEFTKIVRKFL